jgi:4-hydroxythreonine-4-phosphate dehydrogenase
VNNSIQFISFDTYERYAIVKLVISQFQNGICNNLMSKSRRANPAPLAVTMGEPAGIGGEISLKAWQKLHESRDILPFFLIDDPERLKKLADRFSLNLPIIEIHSAGEAGAAFKTGLPVLRQELATDVQLGKLDSKNGSAVISSIERAVAFIKEGEASAIVTNPIHKAALYACGFQYPGHTEFLAALAGVKTPVMMLASNELRVVPLTIHIPLMSVAKHLTQDLVVETARITHASLKSQFGIASPRLVLAGLNPHAGENGTIGREEIDILQPALKQLIVEGINISGPHSADTLFHAVARRNYDVALCPTHDQALIPIKTLGFDEGVNVTLGLPFIRTSPDHGTALEIAEKGIARPQSLIEAIRLASKLVRDSSKDVQ